MNSILKNMAEKSSPLDRKANIWSYTYRIRSHEVEPNGQQLSLPTLFHLMQDGASSHAKLLGLSVRNLMQQGYTWVLSRLNLNILGPLPCWEEQITLKTWPSGNKGPFALRDFLLLDSDGKTVATAISGWLVIDLNRRRPQRIEPYAKILCPVDGEHVMSVELDKIPLLEKADWQRFFAVRRCDLDINQHVNNVRYMDWLLETLPDDIIKKMALKSVQLNFMGEAVQNDEVVSSVERIEQQGQDVIFLHKIIRRDDGRELLRAKSLWQSI